MLEKSKEEYAQMIKSKDLNLEELRKVRNQQAEKLEQIQTAIQELQNSLAFETQRYNSLRKFMALSWSNTFSSRAVMFLLWLIL